MVPATPAAYQLLQEGIIALAAAEHAGMRIDMDYLNRTYKETEQKVKELEADLKKDATYKTWRKCYGEETNLTSRDQLGRILFQELGYENRAGWTSGDGTGTVYATKEEAEKHRGKGKVKPKADEKALEHIDLPFVKKYIKLEKLNKVLGTYLSGILREVVDGFLHPSFNLHTAVSYRSSQQNPNAQNMPARNQEMAKLVRQCFIAREGYHLVELDMSGAEVRVSACYNKDPVLIKYIKDPTTDMHRDTASKLFMLPVEFLKENKDWAKKTIRDWAKNRFVFPEFYGSVWFQCAPDIWSAFSDGKIMMPGGKQSLMEYMESKGITELGDLNPRDNPHPGTFAHQVREVEKDFWNNRFKAYSQWKKDWWAAYQKNGYCQSYTGFTFTMGKRGFLQRNDCLNYCVQGASFHCLLQTLIWMHKWLKRYKMKSRIIGQIHDSIIADVHPSELQDYLSTLKYLLTDKLVKQWKWLIVPLECEADVAPLGKSWYDKAPYIEKGGVWQPEAKA